MKFTANILMFLLPAVAVTCVATAQDALSDSARLYRLDPVTVTGTALEALRSEVPNAVTIVDSRMIRESGETSLLPILARNVPGLFVTERGVMGYGVGQGAGGIFVRGAGGSPNTQVLVLMDGVPNIMGIFGHPLPDMFVTAGVDRVEVIRGPASFMHGGNAMGGAINIISRRPGKSGFGWDAGSSGGSFSTAKIESAVRYGAENSGISIWGSRYQTDGHRPSSSFRVNNGALRGHLALNSSLNIAMNASVSAFKAYDPGPEDKPREDNWVDIFRSNAGLSLENDFGRFRGAAKLFVNYGDNDIYDGFRSRDYLAGILLYQGFSPIEGTMLTFGADYRRAGGNASNIKTNADFGSHAVGETGAYVLAQQELFTLLRLSAGLRYHYHQTAGGEVMPQIGAAVKAAPGTTLKLMAARGFRNPTIRELYLFPAPTPTLKSERLWSYEAGILQEISHNAHAEITAFYAEGDNLIRVSGMFPNLILSNSGRFYHRGIETSAAWQPFASLGVDLSYSALYPGEQTLGNPAHKLWLNLRSQFRPVSLSAGLQYISELYGADMSRFRLPDYLLLNTRATVQITHGLSAFVSADNILGRKYQILNGYPMPGTTLLAGFNWRGE